MHAYIHTYIGRYIRTHTYTYTYIHIHTHTYLHTQYTHTQITYVHTCIVYTHIISQGGTVPFLHPCHQLIFCSKWLDLDLRSCNTLQDGLAQVAAQRVAVPSSMPQTQEESQDETTLSQASTMPWLGLETGGGHMNKRGRERYIYIYIYYI